MAQQMGVQQKIAKLNQNNYITWKGEMRSCLVMADLWEAVEGEVADRIAGRAMTTPAGSAPQVQPATPADRKLDLKALCSLQLNVSDDMKYLVEDQPTAELAWKELHETFRSTLSSRILTLKRQWSSLKQERSESVLTFQSRVSRLQRELEAVGVSYTQVDVYTQILDALLPHFSQTVTYLALSNLSTMSKADFNAKLQWAESSAKKTDVPIAAAVCYGCGKEGHIARNCPKAGAKAEGSTSSPGKGNRRCEHCKGRHASKKCWKKFPHLKPQSNNVQEEDDEPSCSNSEAYLVDAKYVTGRYDPEDFMLLGPHFCTLNSQFGPHSLDAAADSKGSNAQCKRYCSKDKPFQQQELEGENVWCNAPFRKLKTFLTWYREQRAKYPGRVKGTFIVPDDPSAPWWPLLKGFKRIRTWKQGATLFSMPGTGGERVVAKPCHFQVAAFRDEGAKVTAVARLMIDSGASHHMLREKQLFTHLKKQKTSGEVTVGDGSSCPVAGEGSATVSQGDEQLHLKEALLVPALRHNLVSVSGLTDEDAVVTFTKYKCTVQLPTGKEIEGHRQGRLYYLEERSADPAHLNSPEVWHRRMGHLGYSSLAKLPGMSTGVEVDAEECKRLLSCKCDVCELAKFTRKPRPSRTSAWATEPGERLHTDTVGPFEVQSRSGERYMQLTTDEASTFSVVQLMPSKAESVDAMEKTLNHLERRSGKKTKSLRSDRGTEFVNADMAALFSSRNIEHEEVPVYSPESNGLAERSNRTVLDKARCLLQDSGLPNMFWGEAVRHAVMLKNISPMSRSDKTPWELFTGEKPDLSKLSVFGSLAYVFVPKEKRQKLDPRAERAVYLGYDPPSGLHWVYLNGRKQLKKDITVDESKQGWKIVCSQYNKEAEADLDCTWLIPPAAVETANSPEFQSQQNEPGTGLPDAGEPPVTGTGVPAPSSQPADQLGGGGQIPAQTEEPRTYPQRERRAPDRLTFAAQLQSDPLSVEAALGRSDAHFWNEAMELEVLALLENDTWETVDSTSVPEGKKVLPCKWVFKTKKDKDGNVERYKARLVAGGHRQVEGLDYSEVFAPVSKHATLRLFYSKVASDNLELGSIDISNAFLNGVLEQEVYMQMPKGYQQPGKVCRLKRTLYGLKQAPREWYSVLSAELKKQGFSVSNSDAALWYKDLPTGRVLVVHWVDDLQIAHPKAAVVADVKKSLLTAFKGKDLGETQQYLNMKVERDRKEGTLKLSQPTHTRELLRRLGLEKANPRQLPMAPGAEIKAWVEGDKEMQNPSLYSESVGMLLYISCCTRPDISYATNVLARYMTKPTERHFELLKGVVRYLAGTVDTGIVYGKSDLPVQCFTDSDYAACKDSRKSRSGMLFTSFGGAVHWASKLQPVMSLSTAESEYVAGSYAAREAVWLGRICCDLQLLDVPTVELLCDNESALQMGRNPADTSRTKHIDVRYHFIRQCVANGAIVLTFVPTDDNCADLFTKALPRAKFAKFTELIGLS